MNTHPKWIIKYIHKSKIHAVNIVNWEDHHHIATIPHVFDWTDGEPSEGKQAANLFAAAPELLEALREVVEYLDCGDDTRNLELAVELARAAIAKATE